MRAYQDLAEQPGDLPGQLIKHMDWSIQTLRPGELPELKKYVTMMTPIETLFSSLNSETQSTLHLVYPSLTVRSQF